MKRMGIFGILLVALTGVSSCGLGRAKQTTTVNATTAGQQLTDLKKALDEGVITQAEYDKKRESILKDG